MNPKLLIILYLGILITPLALAWAQGLPPRSVMDELASGAGLLALVIILAEFLLSGRFRTISRTIGMDVTMRIHQLFARSALALAVVHPFLYRAEWNPPYPWDVTRRLTLYYDVPSLLTGFFALALLLALVMLALSRARQTSFSYETWRLMHGLGAALIAGLGVFHALWAGRYSADPAMVWLWLGLLAIALFSLSYVYLWKPLTQLRSGWRVASVMPVARKTWELTITPDGHAGLDYAAGQFVWLNVGHTPFSLAENPFSISSAPGSGPKVSFIIKELGDFTNTLGKIEPGTPAHLDGPHGHLTAEGRTEPGIALIAGGVGIAPLIGILRDMHLKGDPRPAILIYGNRTEDQIACREELDLLATKSGSKIIHVLSEPGQGWTGETGFITADLLKRHFAGPEHRTWLYVLCGPPAMLETVETALIDLGVPPRQILSERFSYD